MTVGVALALAALALAAEAGRAVRATPKSTSRRLLDGSASELDDLDGSEAIVNGLLRTYRSKGNAADGARDVRVHAGALRGRERRSGAGGDIDVDNLPRRDWGKGLGNSSGGKSSGNLSGSPDWSDADPLRMRLLELNTWHEGTEVPGGFGMIVDVIAASAADVVVLSEVRNREGMLHERLKKALGAVGQSFHADHSGADVVLLSRWPMDKVEIVSAGIVAYHLAAPHPFVICTAHLDYRRYALMLPRGYDSDRYLNRQYIALERPVTDVETLHAVDEASKRGPEIQAFIKYAGSIDTPVILAGDFNEASHFDWTAATKDLYGHNGVEIDWRHSKLLTDAGFRDSWRELHPDPVTHPGHTWPSEARGFDGNTGWGHKSDERDRIDFVYHNGRGIDVSKMWLAGSPKFFVLGNLTLPKSQCPFFPVLQEKPWPSDHKGLVVEFAVAGRSAPVPAWVPLRGLPGLNMSSQTNKSAQH